MFTDVGPLELITLVVLAVLLFGPDKLPEFIQNVTRVLRKVREFSEDTKQEIRSELGPEFKDFEFEDLHPKTFVRKHVLERDDLGLGEIRGALDPRSELAEIAEAVHEAANGSRNDAPTTGCVTLAKEAPIELAAHAAFDPDAT
ncbi:MULTISPECIES: sec-independent translocase [unclassified Streptomyces]|uniref:sec-independent translocase n=1 Tax=unclassified Streptomyces TaxID=2593676 RepID=UPI003D9473F0